MTASLLDDAFAHHLWATERLIDASAALTPRTRRYSSHAAGASSTTGRSMLRSLRHIAIARVDSLSE